MTAIADPHVHGPGGRTASWAAILGALGVVFGDIGTSPLYALKEASHAASHGGLAPDTVLGLLSLILWSLIVVISIKYCVFILRADNRGEGGIIALLALLGVRRIQPGSPRRYLAALGLVGTALQIDFGDTKVWIGDERIKIHLFVAMLGYSRRMPIRPSRRSSAQQRSTIRSATSIRRL